MAPPPLDRLAALVLLTYPVPLAAALADALAHEWGVFLVLGPLALPLAAWTLGALGAVLLGARLLRGAAPGIVASLLVHATVGFGLVVGWLFADAAMLMAAGSALAALGLLLTVGLALRRMPPSDARRAR